MAGISQLFGNCKVKNKAGESVDLKAHCAGKTVGVYFSAHWCPPCRGFTPELTEFYRQYYVEKNFEIIFLSSDQSQEAFDEYYAQMPWLALQFTDRDVKEKLSRKYRVKGIPTLVLLNADTAEVYTKDARDKIQRLSSIDKFPWANKSSGCLLM